MEKQTKFLLPAPNFGKKEEPKPQHYLTPSGMTLLPRERQPPPMYGPKGTTVPAKFLQVSDNKSTEEPQKRQFCEPCEMELQSIEDLRRHRSQHERCPVDGCKYKGHPSVLDKHVMEFHASGIFDRIKKLSTPEEIAAWREERRKKYPTLANAKIRQLALEQRQRRGERIEQNKARFGRTGDRKRARPDNKVHEEFNNNNNRVTQPTRLKNHESNNKKGRDKRRNARNVNKTNERQVQEAELRKTEEIKTNQTEEIVSLGIKMFKGTSKMEGYKHEKLKQEMVKNVLSSLVGMYGSDDSESGEETDNGENEVQISVSEEMHMKKPEISNESQNKQINIPVSKKLETYPHGKEVVVQNEVLDKTVEAVDQLLKPNTEQTVAKPTSIATNVIGIEVNETINVLNSTHESSDEGPEEAPIQRITTIPSIELERPTTSYATFHQETIEAKRLRIEQSRKKLQEQRKNLLNFRKKSIRKQNTMLEKLLESEIRHERNVLLQCVRYVCKNNFFGIGSDSSSIEESKPSI